MVALWKIIFCKENVGVGQWYKSTVVVIINYIDSSAQELEKNVCMIKTTGVEYAYIVWRVNHSFFYRRRSNCWQFELESLTVALWWVYPFHVNTFSIKVQLLDLNSSPNRRFSRYFSENRGCSSKPLPINFNSLFI